MTEPHPGEADVDAIADADANADADATAGPDATASADVATRVGLAFAPADDEDVADGIETPSFRAYLTKAHKGPVSLGDEWDEFVSCGCGSRKDVTFEVRSITGGDAIGDETEFEYEPASV